MDAKAVLLALNWPATASGSGRLNQLALYTSRSQRVRSSRATMSITLTWPPWPLNNSSFFTPHGPRIRLISVHSAITVAGDSVSVPG